MIKKILPILIFAFFSQTYAQNYFQGIVTEEDTSAPVSDAIVTVEGTAISQYTGANGEFNFTEKIPNGEHVVTITKENYVNKYFLIEAIDGKNITMNDIKIEVDKKERKRREKVLRAKLKEERKLLKEREKLLEQAQKDKEREEKELEKRKRKLLKERERNKDDVDDQDNDAVTYSDIEPINSSNISDLQVKYGALLDVTPETITNTKLFEFIQEWEGTTYLMGGATKEGIDCSSFTQRLYTTVYDRYIERTAEEQFRSKLTDKFLGKEFLVEGDLLFFNKTGDSEKLITHVGIYLNNNRFVHATSYTKDTGSKGVKISNLDTNYWTRKFVAAGRRKKSSD